MVKDNSSKLDLFGNILLLLVIIFSSYTLLTSPRPWIFLDNINLLVHEAGHLIFIFFGDTLQFLGGTIVQILVPVGFFFHFLRRSSISGVSFSLFWIGSNLINVSVYMKDASTRLLPIIGHGIHDWWWLFSRWGVLDYDQTIGRVVYYFGALFLASSIGVLAIRVLYLVSNRS